MKSREQFKKKLNKRRGQIYAIKGRRGRNKISEGKLARNLVGYSNELEKQPRTG